MALTRAQLLMGNSAQGTVLPGEVQGVKQSAGITIAADGSISINSQTIVGVMKLGQTAAEAAAAYNSYDFPNATGTVGQQLTITAVGGGVTTLEWGDPDQIPWTAKGQLVVGTGAGTQTLLNVGANGTFPVADSTTATGFNYVDTVLRTTAAPTTGAAILPASTTANRPATPAAGYTRFNTSTGKLEVYGATTWETVPSSSTTSFVPQTSATGSAILPSGTLAQRDGAPVGGYTRFNSSSSVLEFYNGSAWLSISASASGAFVSQSVPGAGTASAIIFPGTTAQREPSPAAGYMRYNTDTGFMEFYNGAAWSTVTSSASGTFVAQTAPTTGSASAVVPSGTTANRQSVPAPVAGYFRFNTDTAFMEFYNGTAWSTVTSSSTGTFVPQTAPTTGTASVVLPTGTTANRQSAPAPATGYFRYNTDTSNVEWWTGTAWSSPLAGSFIVQTVPTAPVGATANAVIPSGTTAQRQTTPALAAGQFRYNSDLGQLEYYNGAAWVQGAAISSNSFGLGLNVTSNFVRVGVPVQAAAPTAGALITEAPTGSIWYDTTNSLIRVYDGSVWRGTEAVTTQNTAAAPTTRPDGTALQAGDTYYNTAKVQTFVYNGASWASVDERRPVVTAVAVTAKANDYVVVTAATQTITLPATPLTGTCVTVVVAGTFLDTVVARNGSNIMGLAQDITLDKEYAAMQFTYTDATNGWRLN